MKMVGLKKRACIYSELRNAELNGLLFQIPEKKKKKKNKKKKSMVVQHIKLLSAANFINEIKIGDKNDGSDVENSTSQLTSGGVKSLDGEELSPSSMVVSGEDIHRAKSEESQTFNTNKCVLNMEDDGINCGIASIWKVGEYENGEVIGSPRSDKEDCCSRKRKRESIFGFLNWITEAAKKPCDPTIGLVPEKSKWKSYGVEERWKQVLLVREEMYLKRHVDSCSDQSAWQKNQRMHPSLYEDQGPGYNFRVRLRCIKGSSLETTGSKNGVYLNSPSDFDKTPSRLSESDEFASNEMVGTNDSSSPYSVGDSVRVRVLIGSRFQAKVPEWNNAVFESESKWLGTRVWPLEKGNNKFLIERDRIGKGREDLCGCQVPGSIDCVKFHVAEKRSKLKLELCSAFDEWGFNKMGERVSTYWKEEEERKFKNAVRSNPPSLEKCFWDEIVKLFPKKSRADLVSYYFNVFLLQCRGYQNRFSPDNIDSDDEEAESRLGTHFLQKDS